MGDISLKIANSGMETAKAQVSLAMHNIANAGNPAYSEKRVILAAKVSGNSVAGVEIKDIVSKVDEFLEKNLLEITSNVATADVVSDSYKKLQDTLAKPDDDSGIVSSLTKFFNGIDEMGLDPSNPSTRIRMVNSATDLSNNINDIAFFLKSKRFEADQEIGIAINHINSFLSEIRQLGSSLLTQAKNTVSYAQTEDVIREKLRALSELIPIRQYFDKDGILNIKAKDGDYQLVGRSLFQLEYEPTSTMDDFTNQSFHSIYLKMYDDNGRMKQKVPIVYGGKSENINHFFSGGKLAGLLYLRDTYYPSIMENFNQLATNIATAVNHVHNKGVGAMPTTELTAEVPSTLNTEIAGSGSVMITVVDGEGNPVLASSGQDYIPALNLDLDRFNYGHGPGKFNMQGLIDEVNRHFSTVSQGTRASLNGLYDVKLGVVAGGATGNLDLDLDLLAYSNMKDAKTVTVSIESIRAVDVNNQTVSVTNANNIPFAGPKSYTMQNGEHIRTFAQDGFIMRLNNVNNTRYPYTVSVDLKTVINGVSNTVTVSYQVTAPTTEEIANINGIVNKRFAVNNITNDTSVKKGTIIKSTRSSPVISAVMVNEKGEAITNQNEKGFLRFVTKDGMRVLIDQKNSNITSVDYYKHPIVGKGFSESFGMNNLFSMSCDSNKYASNALTIAVRNDIVMDPNHISMNKAEKYKVGIIYDTTPSLYYSVGVGGTELVEEFQALGSKPMHFINTRDIPETDITLKDYAIQVVSIHNDKTIVQNQKSESLSNKMQGIVSQIDAKSGVNLDEQLTSIMFLQNLYSASAKGISTIRALFEQLIAVF